MTIAILCGVIVGCGGDGGSDKRSPATTPEPEAAATPAPDPLTFGSYRYVSPCSALPIEEAERIYGPMGPLGYVRQEFYDRSLSEAELKTKTDTVTNSVQTVCEYNRRDARDMIVHVEVNQYRSEKAARNAWGAIAYLGTGRDSRKLNKMDLSGTGPGFSWDFNFIKKIARENEINMGGKRVKGVDVGPYAFMLAVSRNNTLDLYSGKDLDVAAYTKVVDAIAPEVRTALTQKP